MTSFEVPTPNLKSGNVDVHGDAHETAGKSR
jgi:hypothetical protein